MPNMKRLQEIFTTEFPPFLTKPPQEFTFGTAGYRTKAENLVSCACRSALVVALLSQRNKNPTGLMLSASHNVRTDNGIKLINSSGELMTEFEETLCDQLVNADDLDFLDVFFDVAAKLGVVLPVEDYASRKISEPKNSSKNTQNEPKDRKTCSLLLPDALVFLGRDTRESGEFLEQQIVQTLDIFGVRSIKYGLVTTPQLHFLVRNSTTVQGIFMKSYYYDHLAKNYSELIQILEKEESPILIDTASGVSAHIIKELSQRLPNKKMKIINKGLGSNEVISVDQENEHSTETRSSSSDSQKLLAEKKASGSLAGLENSAEEPAKKLKSSKSASKSNTKVKEKHLSDSNESAQIDTNSKNMDDSNENSSKKSPKSQNDDDYEPDPQLLNFKCGADYIVTHRTIPSNLSVDPSSIRRAVSFDGDADRLIYFGVDPEFYLVDGDRIAVFLANFLGSLISKISNLEIGLVLSHYSNSAAIKQIHPYLKTCLAQTGVKHFVERALTFDVGIYFEPNGHGSLIFSKKAIKQLEKIAGIKNSNKKTDTMSVSDFNFEGSIDLSDSRMTTSQFQALYDEKFATGIKKAKVYKKSQPDDSNSLLKPKNPAEDFVRSALLLLALNKLFDPSTGDAIANFLAIEALTDEHMFVETMITYRNLPTRMLSVQIRDKNVIKTMRDIEITQPIELRSKIELISKMHKGRVFVRPSGTENIVRIFSEGITPEECDSLCVRVAQAVYDICEGIGKHPEIEY